MVKAVQYPSCLFISCRPTQFIIFGLRESKRLSNLPPEIFFSLGTQFAYIDFLVPHRQHPLITVTCKVAQIVQQLAIRSNFFHPGEVQVSLMYSS